LPLESSPKRTIINLFHHTGPHRRDPENDPKMQEALIQFNMAILMALAPETALSFYINYEGVLDK